MARDPIRHPGNQGLFRALELSILSTTMGLPLHVHAEGLRGTGKTTIIRSLRRRLPHIERVKGCLFNCSPQAPHCPEHRRMAPEDLAALGTERVPMPFREISHSAKIGTVAGSIDLARLTDSTRPEAALLPGTIPQAHRGIIFVDEINRLADTAPELADVLLDVMGTKPGQLQLEETGLPCVSLPVSVSVWAASNPDEDPGPLGDIRKQLSDRFDFVIAMERPSAVAVVRDILRASRESQMALAAVPTVPAGEARLRGPAPDTAVCGVEAGGGPGPGAADWPELARTLVSVEVPAQVEEVIASLYVDFGLESLRGVEALSHGARLNCVLERRTAVGLSDVLAVAPGALHHRLDVSTFARVMDYLAERAKADARSGEAEEPTRGGGAEPSGGGSGETKAAPAGTGGRPAAGTAEAAAGLARASRPDGERSGGSPRPEERSRQGAGWSFLQCLFRAAGRKGGAAAGGSPEGDSPGAFDAQAAARSDDIPPGPGSSSMARSAPAEGATSGEERPVPPLHRARPLSEILRDMELAGFLPPGPRVP